MFSFSRGDDGRSFIYFEWPHDQTKIDWVSTDCEID
jgi:hypothetical protein